MRFTPFDKAATSSFIPHTPNCLSIIFQDSVLIFLHDWMKERARWDYDGGTARVLDRGPILHDSPDVNHILTLLVYRTAQQANEGLIGHDLLGNGIEEKAGVNKGLARAFTSDGAFGQFDKGLAAGGLRTDATLNFAHQQKRVANCCLAQGIGQTRPQALVQPGAGLVPIAGALNAHGV